MSITIWFVFTVFLPGAKGVQDSAPARREDQSTYRHPLRPSRGRGCGQENASLLPLWRHCQRGVQDGEQQSRSDIACEHIS